MNPDSPQAVTPLASLSLRVFQSEQEKLQLVVGDDSCKPLLPEISAEWVVSPVLENDGIRVRVIRLLTKEVTAQLFLAGASDMSTRLTENTVTVADDLGRVIVVDLHRNCTIRNFRI